MSLIMDEGVAFCRESRTDIACFMCDVLGIR